MKKRRKRLNVVSYHQNPDGSLSDPWKISADEVYDEIRSAVNDSFFRQNWHGFIPEPYSYEEVLDWVAGNWGIERTDLEMAYSKCRKVYDDAVKHYYQYVAQAFAWEKEKLVKENKELEEIKSYFKPSIKPGLRRSMLIRKEK